jgi:hypothetical protein
VESLCDDVRWSLSGLFGLFGLFGFLTCVEVHATGWCWCWLMVEVTGLDFDLES